MTGIKSLSYFLSLMFPVVLSAQTHTVLLPSHRSHRYYNFESSLSARGSAGDIILELLNYLEQKAELECGKSLQFTLEKSTSKLRQTIEKPTKFAVFINTKSCKVVACMPASQVIRDREGVCSIDDEYIVGYPDKPIIQSEDNIIVELKVFPDLSNINLSECVEVQKVKWGGSCGNPRSVSWTIRNSCNEDEIDVLYYLERLDGSQESGLFSNIGPGQSRSSWSCESTGYVMLQVRSSNSTWGSGYFIRSNDPIFPFLWNLKKQRLEN